MFQKAKKKPPPRPPPPNFNKYKSKSSFNLAQPTQNLIDLNLSPPSSPKPENWRQFGGSVSSSYSSSASSLTSSKKSLENDATLFPLYFTPQPTINWVGNSKDTALPRPRIIRPQLPKKPVVKSEDSLPINNLPPMPSVPPLSPPKEHCEVVTPYGIALYDFLASQPGDLALQAEDVVILLRRVNKEWLYGQVGDQEGIFPENFLQIKVPIPGESQIVTALHEFIPQIAGDLELKSGQTISASSLTSSKKSLENDATLFPLYFTPQPTINLVGNSKDTVLPRPRIMRPQLPKKPVKTEDSLPINNSPPMPSVPPPSPPKEHCEVVTPYGIALYDFPASQPGDLPLQAEDVVILLRRVNKEWLYGQVGDQEGIFPENFLQIKVPIPGESQIVTALHEFIPGDLELKSGQTVRVIKEISSDWLYGEANGKVGQFSRNFVSQQSQI